MIIFQSLISLGMLFLLVFFLYDRYRVDRLRQRLFEIRDRLFDEATHGRIHFDSKGYGYARTVMNGMIRFSHRISIVRFLTAAVILSDEERQEAREKQALVMSATSEADRVVCEKYLREANLAVVKHLGMSPFSFLVLLPIIASVVTLVFGYSLASWIVKEGRSLFARLDLLAYEEGKLHRHGVDSNHLLRTTRF